MATGAVLALTLGCLDPLGAPDTRRVAESRAIEEENLHAGTLRWDGDLFTRADSNLSGYGLPTSLQAGDTLHVFAMATHLPVATSIYRLGWYNGVGARLVARHLNRPATTQAACTADQGGTATCDWPETDRFVVGPHWLPGVYLARLSDSLGRPASFPFIVRSDHPAAFVVVLPFATYQAYNAWGGTSLYGGPGSTPAARYASRAVKASFARPFADEIMRGRFFGLEYLLVRWLEQNAYDVSYMSDYDFHLGRGPDPAVAWLFAGHSEYWTWPMWVRANAARAQGLSLGFLGGNDIYWMARFEGASAGGVEAPVVVCYRDASLDPEGGTPGLATVLFRSAPNNTPENSLVGVMSVSGTGVSNSPVDLVVADGSDSLMVGTGLVTGQHIPRVAGWEGDRLVNNGLTPAGIRTLFASPYTPIGDTAATGLLEATVYEWPSSHALVYASGEPGFAWGLSSYRQYVARPAIQQFLRNVLSAFVAARSQ